jgi:hypothetical protein
MSGEQNSAALLRLLHPPPVMPGSCAGHPRPKAIVNFKSGVQRRRVDGRDKPGHDVEGWRIA